MPGQLTCPRGHQWELRDAGPPAAEGARTCPVCGAEAVVARASTPLPTEDHEQPTLAPPTCPGEPAARTLSFPETAGELPPPGCQDVPGYEILGELGRGGMGVVYKARQKSLQRVVALKMILGGAHAGGDSLVRFRSEAEAVACVQHPNIVQIYEVGEQGGVPYFSLEFVDGGSLAQKLNGKPLPAPFAARLVEQLARAVRHAHEHGIVHRDLKPANILLTCDGTPKITDFGLAKHLGSRKGQTQSGSVLGTPSYMAPEQAEGKTGEIGPAVDVYALGAILYELITGRPPFLAETPLDTVLQVISQEPVPPRRLHLKVPPDLETICLKCLEKEPAKRYPTALALAEELERFQNGEPILARPISTTARAWRWCKRRPLASALGAVLTAVVLFLAVAGPWIAHRQAVLKAQAEANDREAQIARERADEAAAQNIGLAHQEWLANNVKGAEQRLDRCPDQFRGWEWHYLKALCSPELLTLRGLRAVTNVAFRGQGDVLVTADMEGVRTWDAATGQQTGKLDLPQRGALGLSPDGRLLAATVGGDRQEIHVWDLRTSRELVRFLAHDAAVTAVAFDKDGQRLVSGAQDKSVKVWDPATGDCLQTLRGAGGIPTSLAVGPDGKRVAAGDDEGTVRLWDAGTGREQYALTGHRHGELMAIPGLAFSPDGKRLASASNDGTVKVWDVEAGQEVVTLRGHLGFVYGVAFSPDGKRLASAAWDQTVRLWDAATGQPQATLRGHSYIVIGVAFSPDGKRLATASADGTARLWDASVTSQEYRDLAGHQAAVAAVAFHPDGRYLASASWDKTVKVWDVGTGRELGTFRGHNRSVGAVAFSPDGKRIASASGGWFATGPSEIRVWDPVLGRETLKLSGHSAPIGCLAYSPDGKWLASGTASVQAQLTGEVKVWDAQTGTLAHDLTGHRAAVCGLAFSPGGERLATAGLDGTIQLWSMPGGQPLFTLRQGVGLRSVAFSPDGNRVVAAGNDAVIHVWDLTGRAEVLSLRGHTLPAFFAAYSPDGKRIVSTGHDATIKVWDAATGMDLLTLRGHTHEVYAAVFSPDGNLLASCSFDGHIHLRDAKVPALPRTDDWKVLLADDFQKPKLAPHWDVDSGENRAGKWTVERGALRGVLAKVPDLGSDLIAAGIRLRGQRLPSTVEVRFDWWSPDEVNCQVFFDDDSGTHGLDAMLLGVSDPRLAGGARGAVLRLQSAKLAFAELISSQHVQVRPNTRYRVRALREPKRLTLFVNDAEVVSSSVPELDLPRLTLQGERGKAGSVIYIDNVEIRAPLSAIQERDARSLVETLAAKIPLKSEVQEQVRGHAGLSDGVRKLALQIAESLREDPEKLNAASRAVVHTAGQKRDVYQRALREAEEARRLAADDWRSLETLALAQYRVSRFDEAAESAGRAAELCRRQTGSATPAQLAVLALASRQRGRKDEARSHFVQLRDLMRGEGWAADPESRLLLQEAEARADFKTALRPEDEAVKEAVFRAEQAGWLHHDLAAYLAVRGDDPHEVGGRGEEPEAHDVDFDRGRLAAVRRIQFQGPVPEGVRFSFENVHVRREGDEAELRFETVVQWENGFKTYGAVDRLRKTPQGWKLIASRGWPVREKQQARLTVYDAAFWEAKDHAVERARSGDDPRKLVRALLDALRPAEAHAAARELTAREKAHAEDWALRGEAAVDAGDAADAVASFHKALALNLDVALPYYLSREILTFRGHDGPVFGAAFYPDGGRVASAGDDRTLRIWDAATGRPLADRREHDARISGVACSPDGHRLATCGHDRTVRVWDADILRTAHILAGHTGTVYRVAFSADSRRLVSASADQTARVWDVATGRLLRTLTGHTGHVLGAVFSPDGRRVATASHDQTVRVWDADTGKELLTLRGHAAQLIRVAYSPDGRLLASAGSDQLVKLWDAATGQEVRTLRGHTALVETVAFSPDCRRLASAGEDATVRVWDTATGRPLLALHGHGRGRIFAVDFSPDGRRLASASQDGTVKLWDLGERAEDRPRPEAAAASR